MLASHTQLSLFPSDDQAASSREVPARPRPLRIAALVDGDNVSYRLFAHFHEHLTGLGNLVYCRVFLGTTSSRAGWEKVLDKAGLTERHRVIDACSTRNATDIRIAMAAVELADRRMDLDAFAFYSADGDFFPVAERIKRTGRRVYGFGPTGSSQAFRSACDSFFALSFRVKRGRGSTRRELDAESIVQLENAVGACANGEGWANLARIGSHLAKVAPHLLPKQLGYRSLTKLLDATGRVEMNFLKDTRFARLIEIQQENRAASPRATYT